MRAGIVLTFAAALVLLAGCGGGEDAGSGPRVVAAFYPLAYAAHRIAPDADVENLTPAGSEPHDLELTPRDVEAVRDADVVLYFGERFMPALEDAADDRDNAVDLLAGVRLHDRPEAGGQDGEGSRRDPHVWLDPKRYEAVVRAIARALGRPHGADELVAELDELDADFRRGLATCARREIVTSHAAFSYLADAYDLRQIPLTGLSPEAEPSARAIADLAAEVEEQGATTVFFEPLVSSRLAKTVAREAGVRTAVLNPLEGLTDDEIDGGVDYFSVMRENLAALRRALGCT